MLETRSTNVLITCPHLFGRGIADGVGNVDRVRSSGDHLLHDLAQKINFCPSGIFGTENSMLSQYAFGSPHTFDRVLDDLVGASS